MKNNKIIAVLMLSIISVLSIFSTNTYAFGNDFVSPAKKPQIIKEIYTLANVDKNGDMEITQKWVFNDRKTKGTEHYIPFSIKGLKGARIEDVQVSQNGKDLIEKSWDVNDSFGGKSGYYGINNNEEDLEICFGIGKKQDDNEFIVKYRVTNALERSVDDYLFLDWKFINDSLSNKVAKVRVEVKLPVPPEKIYGFGYEGYVFVKDNDKNTVVYENDGRKPFRPDNYLISLIELQNGLDTNVGRQLNRYRRDIYEESFYDSNYNIDYIDNKSKLTTESMIKSGEVGDLVTKPRNISNIIFWVINNILKIFYTFIFAIFIIKRVIPGIKSARKMSYFDNTLDEDDLDGYYFRDNVEIPPEEFCIPLYIEEMLEFKELMMYFITKWVNQDIIRVKKTEVKKLFGYKDSISLVFTGMINRDMNPIEKTFYDFLIMNVDENYEISAKSLEKEIKWEQLYEKYKEELCENSEEIAKYYYTEIDEKSKNKKILNRDDVEVLKHYYGLKNFLEDFTLMNEREIQEVKIWDYHMEMAAFFGIAEEVQKQLKIYPQVYQGDTMNLGNINSVVEFIEPIMDSSIPNRSNGSGGNASSSGGGGSSGGGSGGGIR